MAGPYFYDDPSSRRPDPKPPSPPSTAWFYWFLVGVAVGMVLFWS